jgi:hypothetical protein
MGNAQCHPDEDMIGGLCYHKCREGYEHPSGIGVTCTRSYTKKSFVIAPQTAVCGPGKKNIAGLCYVDDANMPPGYTRKVIGTLDQTCPSGATDIGVACERQRYSRGAGKIPLHAYIKPRLKEQEDKPAPTCQEAQALFSNPDDPQLCRETVCAEDEVLTGDFCVAKCRQGYTDEGLTCKSATDVYTKRDPKPVVWGTY